MTTEELNGLLSKAVEDLKLEIQSAKTDASKAKQDLEDIKQKYEEAKTKLAETVSQTELKSIGTRIDELTELVEIVSLKGKAPGMVTKTKSIWEYLEEQFTKQKSALEQAVKAKNGFISLHLKDGIVGSDAFGDRVIFGLREPGVDKMPYRENFIFDLINVVNGGPGSNPLSWVELTQVAAGANNDGTAEFTAENATKPNLDWTWAENKVTAETLAAVAYITRQATLNWPILQNEIRTELMREVKDVLDAAVLDGDGTNNTIKGIKFYAKTFALGGLTQLAAPNDFDVIRAAIAQVRRGGAPSTRKRGGFMPNVVLVSVNKAADMDLTKASDGHYIMPPFTTADGTRIKGVRVIETNFVADDEFIVGDFSRYLFNFVEGMRIDIGYINDQFAKNQFTIRAEMMGMGRVKAHETFAFVKGAFTTAKTAMTAA